MRNIILTLYIQNKGCNRGCTPCFVCIAYSLKILVDFFVSLVATHLADSILQHSVLLIEVVYRLLALSVVVHRSLEEEAQEALYAVASGTSSEVAQQCEVEQQRSSEDRVAAEEVNLDLHRVAHPSEDVDVVPSLLVVVAMRTLW